MAKGYSGKDLIKIFNCKVLLKTVRLVVIMQVMTMLVEEKMNKDVDVFLKISKGKYFNNKDFSPIDILVMAQIEEFERNNKDCFISDETMAHNFNVSVSTISRSLDYLEKQKYIIKEISYENAKGIIKKKRQLSIQNEDTKSDTTNQNENNTTNQKALLKDNDLLKDNNLKDKKDNNMIQQNEIKDKKDNLVNDVKMEEEIINVKPKVRKTYLERLLEE